MKLNMKQLTIKPSSSIQLLSQSKAHENTEATLLYENDAQNENILGLIASTQCLYALTQTLPKQNKTSSGRKYLK